MQLLVGLVERKSVFLHYLLIFELDSIGRVFSDVFAGNLFIFGCAKRGRRVEVRHGLLGGCGQLERRELVSLALADCFLDALRESLFQKIYSMSVNLGGLT